MSRYIVRDVETYNTIIRDCPVKIEKTRLLFDKETKFIILQILLTNLSSKEIKKIYFSLMTYDLEKNVLNKSLIIHIKERINGNGEYSVREPIIFKNKNVHFIDVDVKSIIFVNGDMWCNTKNIRKREINRVNLIYTGTDVYKTLVFNDVQFNKICYPEFNDSYWRCSCGCLNLYSSNECRECNTFKEDLRCFFQRNNIEKLVTIYQKHCYDKKRKKIDKINKHFRKVFLVVLIMLLILITSICCGKFEYYKAKLFYHDGEYEKSIAILKKLDTEEAEKLISDVYYDYGYHLLETDEYSKALEFFEQSSHINKGQAIDETKYRLAMNHLNMQKYFEALELFEDIKLSYPDVDERIIETSYLIAMDYFNNNNYIEAISYLKQCKEYKDSNKYIKNILYTYLVYYAEYFWEKDGVVRTKEEFQLFKKELAEVIDEFLETEDEKQVDEMINWVISMDGILLNVELISQFDS